MPKSQVNPRYVLPSAAAPCPCGSGQAFSACCADQLPGLDLGKLLEQARRADDRKIGLIAARADLAQWSIYHQTNTVPAMRAGIVIFGRLVSADIANLSDAAEKVAELMELNGFGSQVGAMFERLRGHIDDPRWARRVTYLHALHAWKRDDVPMARRELAKLGPITDAETDVDILRCAIALNGREPGLSDGLQLFDRMLQLSSNLEDQLRYRGVKAAYYIEHNDAKQARRELQAAIARTDEAHDADLSFDEASCLIWCLSHLGLVAQEGAAFERAARLIEGWLAKPELTDRMGADIYKELGDLHRFAGKAAAAEKAYRNAIGRRESPIARIFLAQVLLHQRKPKDAHEQLRSVEPALLTPEEYEDYLFTLSAVAITLGDRGTLRDADDRLRAAKGSAPYFEQRRLAFVVSVGDAMANGASTTLGDKVRSLLADRFAVLNRYVTIEPKLGPVKLNVNKVVEDMLEDGRSVKRKPRRR